LKVIDRNHTVNSTILEQKRKLNICDACSQDFLFCEHWEKDHHVGNLPAKGDILEIFEPERDLSWKSLLISFQSLASLVPNDKDQGELVWSTALRIAPW